MFEEINWETLEIPGTDDASHAQIPLISHGSLLNYLFIIINGSILIQYDWISKILLKKLNSLSKQAKKVKVLYLFYLEKFFYQVLILFRVEICAYNIQDKCIIASERTRCSRLAHDGLFLLDTVFQTSFNSAAAKQNPQSNKSRISPELNCFDAKSLLATLKLIESEKVNVLVEIILDLERQIGELKVASPIVQWTTLKITAHYSNFLTLLSSWMRQSGY